MILVPEIPARRGHAGEQGQPVAPLLVGLKKIIAAHPQGHARSIGVLGREIGTTKSEVESRLALWGRAGARSQGDHDLLGAADDLAEGEGGRTVADFQLGVTRGSLLGGDHLEGAVLREVLDRIAEEGEKARDFLIAAIELADLGGGVARLPEDGKNRAGDETEDGQGHGDLKEGKSPRSRFRLAAREGHFSS